MTYIVCSNENFEEPDSLYKFCNWDYRNNYIKVLIEYSFYW